MQLQHTHDTDGPVRVTVSASGHPITVVIDPDAERVSVNIITDNSNAAWAGPTGFQGHALGVHVGKSNLVNALRGGSYISGGGTVLRASGRGSVVAGGNITNCAIGRGARVTGEGSPSAPQNGVYLTVPEGCTFSFRRMTGLSVQRDGEDIRLADAEARGWMGINR